MRLRWTLFLIGLAGLLATSSAARADVTSPISQPGGLPLLDSHALGLGADRFRVWADDCQTSLGAWTKVDGLDVAGQNVELTRTAGDETLLVKSWLSDPSSSFRMSNVTVTLVSALDEPVASWRLVDVLPLWWDVSVHAGSSKVALETLELGHKGRTRSAPC